MTRSVVLDAIRRQLAATSPGETRRTKVMERMRDHPRNTIPVRTLGDRTALVNRFCEMLARVHGSTARLERLDQVPHEIARYLGGPAEVSLTPEIESMNLPWPEAPGIVIRPWRPRTSVGVCISTCIGAAAETGTVAIASSSVSPLTQHFLADTHIVLLDADRLVGAYEDVLEYVRKQTPRHMTFVSGPSCTGDIEMVMEYGAHGPRNLHVIVLGGAGSAP